MHIETYLTVYCTVSIKRPGLIFFQKSLLNVRYDRKNEGLCILSNRSHNRMVRVDTIVELKWCHVWFEVEQVYSFLCKKLVAVSTV